MELSTTECEFLYAECFQPFNCTDRLFFIFEVYHRIVFTCTFLGQLLVGSLPPTKEVNAFARVRLSVCELDEMLLVDRCRDMDELINF